MKSLQIKDKFIPQLQMAVQQEMTAETMYKFVGLCAQSIGYFGFAKYFKNEAKSEAEHQEILFEFFNNVGLMCYFKAVEGFTIDKITITGLMDIVLTAEKELRDFFQALCIESMHEDMAVYNIANTMFEIQVKSVGEVLDIMAEIESANGDVSVLKQIDEKWL